MTGAAVAGGRSLAEMRSKSLHCIDNEHSRQLTVRSVIEARIRIDALIALPFRDARRVSKFIKQPCE